MNDKLEVAKREARRYYRAEEKKNPAGFPYSPAKATKAAAAKSGLPASRLIGTVAAVYYAENGARSPLAASAAKSARTLATAIRKRRDAGGRLGRWEVVAESVAATLGRPVSVSAVRALYANAGGDFAVSYTGRGTRAGAPETRESETAEVEATLPE